jgi:hypothetical protein
MVLDIWGRQRQLDSDRAATIRRAVLLDAGSPDIPALSYRWWQELAESAMRPLRRNPAVARYLAGTRT